MSSKTVHPYKVNDQTVNQELILRHGNSEKNFPIDKVSNSPITVVRSYCFANSVDHAHILTERVQPYRQGLRSGKAQASIQSPGREEGCSNCKIVFTSVDGGMYHY